MNDRSALLIGPLSLLPLLWFINVNGELATNLFRFRNVFQNAKSHKCIYILVSPLCLHTLPRFDTVIIVCNLGQSANEKNFVEMIILNR